MIQINWKVLKNKISEILISWDTGFALFIAILAYWYMPKIICLDILKEIYSTAITILTISIPMFFAALAIIISKADDNFINLLEEDGAYSELLFQFKWSLYSLFITFIITLIIYGSILLKLFNWYIGQESYQLAIYIFLFFYSLFAILLVSLDAIEYIKYLCKFNSLKK